MDATAIRKIRERTKKIPVYGGRTEKAKKNGFEDLTFVPAQLAKRPIDYFRENISSKTIIGKNSKKPITLETPIIIGAMSFGALSIEAKTALAKASTLAKTIANTGEGGMPPQERENAKLLIVQYSTGRFGISEDVLKQADAIEVKIGQGAKPGQGGLLLKEKVTDEIAKVRNVEQGHDLHSPPYHKDINTIEELKERIEWLREVTGGVPIILKLGASDEEDIKLAVKVNPDIISIDGMEGGTGAAPQAILDDVGIPTISCLVKARKVLDELNAPQELWIGGGLNTYTDFSKALALGADAVFVGFPLLIAMGCVYCKQCYMGRCPNGLATQDPELRKKLNVDEAAQKAANYITNSTEEIKMIAGVCGKNNIHNLDKDDLRSLTTENSKLTGVRFVGD